MKVNEVNNANLSEVKRFLTYSIKNDLSEANQLFATCKRKAQRTSNCSEVWCLLYALAYIWQNRKHLLDTQKQRYDLIQLYFNNAEWMRKFCNDSQIEMLIEL